MKSVVKTEKLSKWYGNILGISDISMEISPGIKGLLGPNGAGKSTFLKVIAGQLKANIGTVTIFGEPVFSNHQLFSRIGFCPEYDSFFRDNTGFEQVSFLARLHGFNKTEAARKAELAIDRVGLMESKDKLIREYSLGMRQRIKIAGSIVHDPDILMLDEPLRGIDPLWRVNISQIIKDYEKEGKTIIVSSHILPEIEALTNDIILIHQGKVFAQGDIHYIRDLIDTHPHQISIKCKDFRELAAMIIDNKYILNILFDNNAHKVTLNTDNRDKFFALLNKLIVEHRLQVEEIISPDDNLQGVFDYLIGR
ncbi:MAG: ABC transporter ATP-binding protein [Candidatus Aminicenantes bacterium]|nr:ABC transporter ATP-binding protein [Candidatus Aminicenantes bacterium]